MSATANGAAEIGSREDDVTSCAAVRSERFAVNRFDGFDPQMLERLAQDKRLKSAAFLLIKRFAALAAVSGSIVG